VILVYVDSSDEEDNNIDDQEESLIDLNQSAEFVSSIASRSHPRSLKKQQQPPMTTLISSKTQP